MEIDGIPLAKGRRGRKWKNRFGEGEIGDVYRLGKYKAVVVSALEGRARELAEEMKGSSPNRYVLVHRLKMALHLDRPLLYEEQVHHIDENKENNDISNLMIMDGASHSRMHQLARCRPDQRESIMDRRQIVSGDGDVALGHCEATMA